MWIGRMIVSSVGPHRSYSKAFHATMLLRKSPLRRSVKIFSVPFRFLRPHRSLLGFFCLFSMLPSLYLSLALVLCAPQVLSVITDLDGLAKQSFDFVVIGGCFTVSICSPILISGFCCRWCRRKRYCEPFDRG